MDSIDENVEDSDDEPAKGTNLKAANADNNKKINSLPLKTNKKSESTGCNRLLSMTTNLFQTYKTINVRKEVMKLKEEHDK